MKDILRRVGLLPAYRVSLTGASLAALVVAAGFAVAAATGRVRLSDVAAAVTFLLIIAVGLYASRLGAPGRSN